MRKDQTFKAEADKKRDREALKARRANLAGLQQRLKQAGLPVIVLVEGWGAAGKGSVIRSLIRDLGKTHTVILSSHILSEVQSVCDRVLIIAHGRLVAQGTPEELAARLTAKG